MTENEEFIYDSIVKQVRMGFLSDDAIMDNVSEEIEDNEFEDEISKEWASRIIEQERQEVNRASKEWMRPNDTEKLIVAFDKLCDINIIALHNAGYTTSEGESEVVEVERQLCTYKKKSSGYCFYHEQDLMRVIDDESQGMYIASQKINNSSEKITVEVGYEIDGVLKINGFETQWDRKSKSKILIPNFKWQLIYDDNNRDLLDYEAVVKKMIR